MLNKFKSNNFLILILMLAFFPGLNAMLKINSKKIALLPKALKILGNNKNFWFKKEKNEIKNKDVWQLASKIIENNFHEDNPDLKKNKLVDQDYLDNIKKYYDNAFEILKQNKFGNLTKEEQIKFCEIDLARKLDESTLDIQALIANALVDLVQNTPDEIFQDEYRKISGADIQNILEYVGFFSSTKEEQIFFCKTGLPRLMKVYVKDRANKDNLLGLNISFSNNYRSDISKSGLDSFVGNGLYKSGLDGILDKDFFKK